MSAKQLMLPANRAFDSNGAPAVGARAFLYQSGTSTPAAFFDDVGLTVSLGSVITANSAGRFTPMPYQESTTPFRLVIEDEEGAVLDDIDPFYFGQAVYDVSGGATVATRVLLAAITGAAGTSVYLTEAGREGVFTWNSTNLSASVTIDTAQGIYVAPATDTTGASGAWVRRFENKINASWFGLSTTGTGAANATALNAAIAYHLYSDTPLKISAGTFNKTGVTTITGDYIDIEGAGPYDTVFKPTSATETFIIKSKNGRFANIGCDGVVAGTYGIVVKDGNSTVIDRCDSRNFDNDGILIDPTYGGGADGSNNSLKIINTVCGFNTQCGVRMIVHADNNNISFIGVSSSSNGSHGLLANGTGGYVDASCLFEGNSGYGIQIGVNPQSGLVTGWNIDRPWIEGNTLGGVFGAYSQGNKISMGPGGQSFTTSGVDIDTVDRITSGLRRMGSVDDDTFVQTSAIGGNATVKAVKASGGDANLNLYGQNSGGLIFGSPIFGTITSTVSATGNQEVQHYNIVFGGSAGEKKIVWNDPSNTVGKIALVYDGASTTYLSFGSFYNSGYTSTEIFRLTPTGATVTGNLSVTGTISGGMYTVQTKTTGYTATETTGDVVVKCDLVAGFTVVLPTAVGNKARFTFKKIQAAGAIVIDGNGTETIDGGLTATLNNQNESITIVSDNANWIII